MTPCPLGILTRLCLAAGLSLVVCPNGARAQTREADPLLVQIVDATPIQLAPEVDSNSPVFWDPSEPDAPLHVVTSVGHPAISTGRVIWRLGAPEPVQFDNEISGSRWMEAVVPDGVGGLYGYYHNEPTGLCGPTTAKTAPRIGAAVSRDGGETWHDLGIVLEAPPGPLRCSSPNKYFAGGVGDFTAILSPDHNDLYFFFSTYGPDISQQGVAVARMAWADRDEPRGHLRTWSAGVWREPMWNDEGGLTFPAATPIYTAARSWYSSDGRVDALWGPSVHWNSAVSRYVMLLNRASNGDFRQEGIYLSSSGSLDDPSGWTQPQRVMSGGSWYPQVVGLEPGVGTDKFAGRISRLFVSGHSTAFLVVDMGQRVD